MARRPPPADSRRKQRSRPTPKWLVRKPDLDTVARTRVLMVLSVLSGEKPVSTAIEETKISRGFYYQLETKALNAMLLALSPGSDSDPSPDATGLHARIKALEDQLARAVQERRRAERLLLMTRKVVGTGQMKTNRGRPPKATSSTSSGPSGSRTSTRKATKATTKPASPVPSPSTASPAGVSEAP